MLKRVLLLASEVVTLFAALTLPVGATLISTEAVLSHTDLSPANPISYSVDFNTTFSAIESLTIDAFWAEDGLDPAEGINYADLGGYTNNESSTQFERQLVLTPASNQDAINQFFNGTFQGTIFADPDNPPFQIATTATYDRLTFTIDATPGVQIPETGSLALLGLGLTGLFIFRRKWGGAGMPERR